MVKRDYNIIVKALRKVHSREAFDNKQETVFTKITTALMDAFKDDNVRFDKIKFLQAVCKT